jgi:hypothetical protein
LNATIDNSTGPGKDSDYQIVQDIPKGFCFVKLKDGISDKDRDHIANNIRSYLTTGDTTTIMPLLDL